MRRVLLLARLYAALMVMVLAVAPLFAPAVLAAGGGIRFIPYAVTVPDSLAGEPVVVPLVMKGADVSVLAPNNLYVVDQAGNPVYSWLFSVEPVPLAFAYIPAMQRQTSLFAYYGGTNPYAEYTSYSLFAVYDDFDVLNTSIWSIQGDIYSTASNLRLVVNGTETRDMATLRYSYVPPVGFTVQLNKPYYRRLLQPTATLQLQLPPVAYEAELQAPQGSLLYLTAYRALAGNETLCTFNGTVAGTAYVQGAFDTAPPGLLFDTGNTTVYRAADGKLYVSMYKYRSNITYQKALAVRVPDNVDAVNITLDERWPGWSAQATCPMVLDAVGRTYPYTILYWNQTQKKALIAVKLDLTPPGRTLYITYPPTSDWCQKALTSKIGYGFSGVGSGVGVVAGVGFVWSGFVGVPVEVGSGVTLVNLTGSGLTGFCLGGWGVGVVGSDFYDVVDFDRGGDRLAVRVWSDGGVVAVGCWVGGVGRGAPVGACAEFSVRSGEPYNLTNVPVLVEVNSSWSGWSVMSSSPGDIYATVNGEPARFWVEEWNYTARTGRVWVLVPSLPANGTVNVSICSAPGGNPDYAVENLPAKTYYQPGLREHQTSTSYHPYIEFTIDSDNDALRIAGTSTSSLGVAYVVLGVFSRDELNGAKVTVRWNVYYTYSDSRNLELLLIYLYKGVFDAAADLDVGNAVNDDNSVKLLVYPYQHKSGWNGWFTQSTTIDTSSVSSQDVTLILYYDDWWTGQQVIGLIDYVVLEFPNGTSIVWDFGPQSSIEMVRTGTYEDYGYAVNVLKYTVEWGGVTSVNASEAGEVSYGQPAVSFSEAGVSGSALSFPFQGSYVMVVPSIMLDYVSANGCVLVASDGGLEDLSSGVARGKSVVSSLHMLVVPGFADDGVYIASYTSMDIEVNGKRVSAGLKPARLDWVEPGTVKVRVYGDIVLSLHWLTLSMDGGVLGYSLNEPVSRLMSSESRRYTMFARVETSYDAGGSIGCSEEGVKVSQTSVCVYSLSEACAPVSAGWHNITLIVGNGTASITVDGGQSESVEALPLVNYTSLTLSGRLNISYVVLDPLGGGEPELSSGAVVVRYPSIVADPSFVFNNTLYTLGLESDASLPDGANLVHDNNVFVWVLSGVPGRGELVFRFIPEPSVFIFYTSDMSDARLVYFSDETVSVYDAAGRLVYSAPVKVYNASGTGIVFEAALPEDALPNGAYIVEVYPGKTVSEVPVKLKGVDMPAGAYIRIGFHATVGYEAYVELSATESRLAVMVDGEVVAEKNVSAVVPGVVVIGLDMPRADTVSLVFWQPGMDKPVYLEYTMNSSDVNMFRNIMPFIYLYAPGGQIFYVDIPRVGVFLANFLAAWAYGSASIVPGFDSSAGSRIVYLTLHDRGTYVMFDERTGNITVGVDQQKYGEAPLVLVGFKGFTLSMSVGTTTVEGVLVTSDVYPVNLPLGISIMVLADIGTKSISIVTMSPVEGPVRISAPPPVPVKAPVAKGKPAVFEKPGEGRLTMFYLAALGAIATYLAASGGAALLPLALASTGGVLTVLVVLLVGVGKLFALTLATFLVGVVWWMVKRAS